MKTPATNRYLVSDEQGPLRAFNTRHEALFFMSEGMTLKVLPKPVQPDLMAVLGEAPF